MWKHLTKPRIIYDGLGEPYLRRWHLLPKNKFFNVWLHQFLKDDDDRAMHDHPFASLSLCVSGSYDELCSDGVIRTRKRGAIVYRSATYRHSIFISNRPHKTAWTLFVTGRVVRKWGFWCDENTFILSTDYHSGDGCD